MPVQSPDRAKSRLIDLPGREQLVWAMAQDTVAALRHCPLVESVYVMTPDPTIIPHALAAQCLTDARPGSLNGSLAAAVAVLRDMHPGRGVAIVLADLPCARPDDIIAALEQATGPSMVNDQQGTGTTMLLDPSTTSPAPHFGAHSCAAHTAEGFVNLAPKLPPEARARLQRDVDTSVDLWDALRIGTGAATQRWSEAWSDSTPTP